MDLKTIDYYYLLRDVPFRRYLPDARSEYDEPDPEHDGRESR